MTTHEFNNQASQSERREVLRNDTMLRPPKNTIDDAGGRFAKLTPATITGATSPQYPQLPAIHRGLTASIRTSNPLGFSVDAMEPVGTQAEIEASLNRR